MQKKGFALRINGEILDAVKRWSDDELRSVNAQIEYVLRDALRRAGRLSQSNKMTDPDNTKNEAE